MVGGLEVDFPGLLRFLSLPSESNLSQYKQAFVGVADAADGSPYHN
jgi:hypothetical protein